MKSTSSWLMNGGREGEAMDEAEFRRKAYELVEADIRKAFRSTHFEVHEELNAYLEAECIEVPETTGLMQSVDLVLGYMRDHERTATPKPGSEP